MRRHIPLLFCMACLALVSMVALSGCVGQEKTGGPQYKNDVITIEDYYVSNLKPYAGSEATMEFLVQNNGEHPVKRVTVSFFDTSGLTVKILKCSGEEIPLSDESRPTCVFGESEALVAIEPLDVRQVVLRLGMPSDSVIKKPTSFTVSYRIEYDYSGYRKADLPVVDGVTVRTASSKYSQSTPSYGPIRLDFEMPVRGEHKEGTQTVKEYWGVRDEPFEVVFKLTDVADSKLKDKTPIIAAGNLMLDAKGSLARADGLPCDFCKPGETGCMGTDSKYLYLGKDAKVPSELRCSFRSYDFIEPETFATLWAQYNYTYGYTLTEKFEVQPVGEAG